MIAISSRGWLSRCVDFGVSLQIAAVNECSRAHVAFIWPGSGVDSLMNQQLAGAGESFAAITTQIRLFFCVRSNMNFM